jgi:hypothetical protein
VSIHGHIWGAVERARCKNGSDDLNVSHRAPVSGCTCGLYAKHTLQDVEQEFDGGGYMFGSIKAHGRIILGDQGFRAEYAEIEALLWYGPPIRYVDPAGDLVTALNSVPFYTDRRKFLKNYPPISVDHLLPEKEPMVTTLDSDLAKLRLDLIQLRADARRAYRTSFWSWDNE